MIAELPLCVLVRWQCTRAGTPQAWICHAHIANNSSHMGPGLGGVWWAEPLSALSTARAQRGYCAAGLMAMQWADWAVHINPVATQAQGPGL